MRRLNRILLRAVPIATLLCVLGAEVAHAQFARGRETDSAVQKTLTEHHSEGPDWRRRIYDLHSQVDTVDSELRAKRDEFFDALGPKKTLLEDDVQVPIRVGENDTACLTSGPALIPRTDDDIWVVATLDSVKAFLSNSKRSVYTELNFTPSRIMWGIKHVPTLGALFQESFNGGAVRMDNGQVLVYQVLGYPWYILEAHQYLLRLQYGESTHDYGVFEAYPVIDGVVSASHKFCERSSPLIGQTVDQAQHTLWEWYFK